MLLDEVRAAIGRYVVLPSEEALTAVTLWVAATHIQTALQHAPRLAVVGPTKSCGKSRVPDVLHETVAYRRGSARAEIAGGPQQSFPRAAVTWTVSITLLAVAAAVAWSMWI